MNHCQASEVSPLHHTHAYTHPHTHLRPQTSDIPIAEAMKANSYVRHSNLCWDYTIQQLARLMNSPPLMFSLVSTTQLIEVAFSGQ